LNLASVGAGLSQVLPCLAALPSARRSLVSLEQPELHLNPRQCAAFGDVLLDTLVLLISSREAILEEAPWFNQGGWMNGVILVETHSEAMMLRVLRRIREASNHGEGNGKPLIDRMQAVFVDTRNAEEPVQRITAKENGEWISKWPDGFFRVSDDERY
ncbi:hypothetical protein N8596_00570, partial [bacterium]|nr:hypothetical protein [bacterium]